jgi:REP element-mobilizing transposase RayT
MRVRTESEKRCKSTLRGKSAPAVGQFAFMNHGGDRKGSGRKAAKGPDGKRLHNPHSARESFTWSRPVHVTVNVRAGLPSLRGPVLASVVLKGLEAGNEREGFRLVHFSLQTNHVHLICEAEGPAALAAAIKGLNGRIAKAINKRLGLKGKVIADRYHLEVLRTPTQVRNAVRYVLRNGEKHGVHLAVRHGDPRPCPDPLSSAAWFGYWKEGELNVLATQSAVTVVKPAECFLLGKGLQRVEPLSLLDAPPGREKVAPATFPGADVRSIRSASESSSNRSRPRPARTWW